MKNLASIFVASGLVMSGVSGMGGMAGAVWAQQPVALKPSGPGTPPPRAITNSLGNSVVDLVYSPLAEPCRVLDTRSGSGTQQFAGPLVAGTVYPFRVTQQGSCAVPFGADGTAAVMVNIVAVTPAGAGDLRMWSWDSSDPAPPNASVINYSAVSGLNIANGVVLRICNTATATGGTCTDDLFVRADVAGAHLIVDVLGFFAPPFVTGLNCTMATNTTTIPPNSFTSVSSTGCGIAQTMTGGGCGNTADGQVVLTDSHLDVSGSTPVWICFYKNSDATTTYDITASGVCCQVPGRPILD
jgi:hypothetical protein